MTDRRPRGSGMRSRNKTSPTRQGVAAKELQEARRKRRQQEVMRNRIILAVICLLVLVLVIFFLVRLIGNAFNLGKTAEESTITFMDNGQVVFEEVTPFDTDTYSVGDLKDFANIKIDSFNDTYGEEVISLDKIKVKGDVAYIKTTYKSADIYSTFTAYETYQASYEDAVAAGYDFGALFSTVADGALTEGQVVDSATLFAGSQVVVVDENVTVVVPGTITYVSNANIEVKDTDSVSITQADGNEDATDLVYIIYKEGNK